MHNTSEREYSILSQDLFENDDFHFSLDRDNKVTFLVLSSEDFAWFKFKSRSTYNPNPFNLNIPVLAMWALFIMSIACALCVCCFRSLKWHKMLKERERQLGIDGQGIYNRMLDPNNPNIPMDYLTRNRYNPYHSKQHKTPPPLINQSDIDWVEPITSLSDPWLKYHPLTGQPLQEYPEPINFEAESQGRG